VSISITCHCVSALVMDTFVYKSLPFQVMGSCRNTELETPIYCETLLFQQCIDGTCDRETDHNYHKHLLQSELYGLNSY